MESPPLSPMSRAIAASMGGQASSVLVLPHRTDADVEMFDEQVEGSVGLESADIETHVMESAESVAYEEQHHPAEVHTETVAAASVDAEPWTAGFGFEAQPTLLFEGNVARLGDERSEPASRKPIANNFFKGT